jgi:hypothetical protein
MFGWIALLFTTGCTRSPEAAFDPIAILVTPERPVVSLGETAQLTATGVSEDRASADLTVLASWYSDDPTVVSVRNDLDREGIVEAVSLGETTIWAALDEVESVPVTVRVTEAELVALEVQPESVDAVVGDVVPLKVEALFSDGLRTEAQRQVRWITEDGDTAQLSDDGTLTAMGEGSTEIFAAWDEVESRKVPVTVGEAPADAQPDLRIENVQAHLSNGNLVVDFQIRNAGTSGASDFWVDLFVDPSDTPTVGEYGTEFVNAGYAGPGQTLDISYTTGVSGGSHTFAIVVDSTGAVAESDEANNVYTGSATEPASALPDLAVTRIDWIADTRDVYFEATIRNLGGAESEGFLFEFFVDRSRMPTAGLTGDVYAWVDPLPAGGSKNLTGLVNRACAPCKSWAVVDLEGEIDESDESNNLLGSFPVTSDDEGVFSLE